MVDLAVKIGSLRLPNPVVPGSGTMAEGLAEIIDLGRLGAVVLKTITPDIRQGTLPPRVAESPDATLSWIGIPSKGPDYPLRNIIPFYEGHGVPVIASISADTVEDFGRLAARISVPSVAARRTSLVRTCARMARPSAWTRRPRRR